jgi:anion transporter
MSPDILSLVILLAVVVVMLLDKIELWLLAMLGALVCCFTGLYNPAQLISVMGTATTLLLMGLFIMGAAMFRSGLASLIARSILKFTGKSEMGVMLVVMIGAVVLSAVASNVAVVLALIPVAQGLCKEMNLSTSRIMYPLAAAAGFGGTITLIGTTSNIVGNTVLEQFELAPLSFFGIAWIGIPLTIVGMLWMMTIGRKTLPRAAGYEQDTAGPVAETVTFNKKKMILTAVIFGTALILMIVGAKFMPLTAFIAALLLIMTGCISEKEAFGSLDWRLFLLIAGFSVITGAVTNSGGGKLIGTLVINSLQGNSNPYLVTAVVFIVTALMTSFLNNVGTALLMGPIAAYIAQGMNINPAGLIIVVVIAANACFATPVGAPAFTLVLEPGHYKFKDFVRMGLPLTIINAIIAIIIIPLVWKF